MKKRVLAIFLSTLIGMQGIGPAAAEIEDFEEYIFEETTGEEAESDELSEDIVSDETVQNAEGSLLNGDLVSSEEDLIAEDGIIAADDASDLSGTDSVEDNLEQVVEAELQDDTPAQAETEFSQDEDSLSADDLSEDTIEEDIASLYTEGQNFIPAMVGMADEDADDDLFAAYLVGAANGENVSSIGTAGERLTGLDRCIYSALLEDIIEVASGNRASTVFEISLEDLEMDQLAWSASELGVETIVDGSYISEAALDALYEQKNFDLPLIIEALLLDCPFELYWYEKTLSTSTSGMRVTAFFDETTWEWMIGYEGTVSFYFPVADEYSAGEYTVDTEIGKSVQTVVGKALSIVNKYSEKDNHEKLDGYRKEICDLVSYNDEAAGGEVAYGNPWQLIWVFDENPATNVVCEGYSKAFQYLCNLTDFQAGIKCITVSGTMVGGTGEGPHMWNIVTMEDGKNYLVDVTNCDEGTIGATDLLFLKAKQESDTEGNCYTGYRFEISGDTIAYFYDTDTLDFYTEEELTLSEAEYQPGAVPTPTPTPTATPTPTPTATPTPTPTAIPTPGIEEPYTIQLSDSSVSMLSNETRKITVSDLSDGDRVVSWESADESIATVDQDGTITGKRCGQTVVTVTLLSELTAEIQVTIDHTVVIDNKEDPTCTNTGLTEGSHCSVCEEVLVRQEEIPAEGHKFGEWSVVKEPTAIEEGKKERICSVCKKKEEEKIPKLTPNIKLSLDSVTLDVRKSQKITVSDLTAGDYISSWKSEDESIAAVKSGLITGIGPGVTKVIVTLKSGCTGTVKVTVKESLLQPKLIAAYNGAHGIGVKFFKVDNADSYVIYQKFNGVWSPIETIKANSPELQAEGNRLMYTDRTVAKLYGKGYIYSVEAKKGKLGSGYNKTGVAIYRLNPPAITKAENSAAGTAKVTWKSVFGKTESNGNYDLQMAEYVNSKAGTFNSVTKLPGYKYNVLTAAVKGLKKGKTYVFRIRCSKTNKDRGTFYSEYSPWKTLKITK